MEGLTGCVGILETGVPGPVTALRFDIDCVKVAETDSDDHLPCKEGFASTQPGLMHACGHDGHTAIGIALATWLRVNREKFCGTIKLLFQPAEEGVRGARPMAESGVLDDVDNFLGMHLSFIANSGEVVLNPTHFLCTTKLDIRYSGKPAHAGAEPHKGRNALAAAANASVQLLGIARHGEGMTRINIGELHAGEGRNVVPAHAVLKLEVRGENETINSYMVEQVEAVAKGCAMSFGVDVETEVMGEAVDLVNSPALIERLGAIAREHPSIETVIEDKVFGGSEDATILAKRVQKRGGEALFFIVGADRKAGHHQAEFDFDEKQMNTAFDLYAGMLTSLHSR